MTNAAASGEHPVPDAAAAYKEVTFNRLQVSFEIVQLLSNRLASHFGGVFAASCVFQIIFLGTLAVGARLPVISRIYVLILRDFLVVQETLPKKAGK